MGKVTTKFYLEMNNGRPSVKFLDMSSPIKESVVVLEGNSLAENVKQFLSYVYDECRPFSGGYCAVRSDKRWGYVDVTLYEIITPRFQFAYEVCEGFALVKDDGKYFFYKMSDVVSPYKWNEEGFDEASSFCNGFAKVKKNGLYGYLDSSIKDNVEIGWFEEAYSFDKDYPFAVVKESGKYGVINKEGRFVVEPMFETYTPSIRCDGSLRYNATIGDRLFVIRNDGTYYEVNS